MSYLNIQAKSILLPELRHGSNVLQQLNKMFISMSEVHSNLRVYNDICRISYTAQHCET